MRDKEGKIMNKYVAVPMPYRKPSFWKKFAILLGITKIENTTTVYTTFNYSVGDIISIESNESLLILKKLK